MHNDLLSNFFNANTAGHNSSHFDYSATFNNKLYTDSKLLEDLGDYAVIYFPSLTSSDKKSVLDNIYSVYDNANMVRTTPSKTYYESFEGNLERYMNSKADLGLISANDVNLLRPFLVDFDNGEYLDVYNKANLISTPEYDVVDDKVLFSFKNGLVNYTEPFWASTGINESCEPRFIMVSRKNLTEKQSIAIDVPSVLGGAVDGVVLSAGLGAAGTGIGILGAAVLAFEATAASQTARDQFARWFYAAEPWGGYSSNCTCSICKWNGR